MLGSLVTFCYLRHLKTDLKWGLFYALTFLIMSVIHHVLISPFSNASIVFCGTRGWKSATRTTWRHMIPMRFSHLRFILEIFVFSLGDLCVFDFFVNTHGEAHYVGSLLWEKSVVSKTWSGFEINSSRLRRCEQFSDAAFLCETSW